MDVRGCQVIPEPSDKYPSGFETTCHLNGQVRGPFPTIKEAVDFAIEWTASTNDAVQIEPPKENPPVVDHAHEPIDSE